MKHSRILSVAFLVFACLAPAKAEFIPGHVFVAEFAQEACNGPFETYRGDRIWRIDPESGEKFLFAALDEEACGSITDMVFTPDVTRLRVAQHIKNRILEFDSDGNYTVLYDSSDGIFAPTSANCMTFDAHGNFYVSVFRSILKFVPNAQTPEIFASSFYADDSFITNSGPIAFDSFGYLYYENGGGGGQPGRLLQFSAPHTRTVFATSFTTFPVSLQGDSCGHLFAGYFGDAGEYPAKITQFENGDPVTEIVLVEGFAQLGFRPFIALDPTQTVLYVATQNYEPFPPVVYRVEKVSIQTGVMEPVVDIPSFPVGLAVVPVPSPPYGYTPCLPPIPTVTGWGATILTLVLLIISKISFGARTNRART